MNRALNTKEGAGLDPNEQASQRKAAIFVISLASFLFPFMASAVNIAIPTIGKNLDMSAVAVNWIAASFLLAAAILSVPFGRLADIHGRRKLFVIGLIGYTIASLLCGIAGNAEQLIVFRVLQGISGSMYSGAGMAIIISVFPPGERGKALGIVTAAVYFGLSCGPFIGGILTQNLGWRSIFLMTVPVCLFILFLVLTKLKGEWAEAKGEKFDIPGSVMFAVTIFSSIYGFSILPHSHGLLLLGISIVTLTLFIRWEQKTEFPVLNINLFTTSRTFAFSNLAALINYSSTFAVMILLSLYLQHIQSLTPQIAGIILVTQPIMQAILSPTAGKLSDMIDPQIVASIGIGITMIGLFMLAFLDSDTGILYIIGSLALLGLGFALFSSPNVNAVMSATPKAYIGVGASVLGTMRITGQTLSMSISTLVFGIYLGSKGIKPDTFHVFLQSVRLSFIIFTVLSLFALFASLARGKTNREVR